MCQLLLTKMQLVGKSGSTAWSTCAHKSFSNCSIMRLVSLCKPDVTIEL